MKFTETGIEGAFLIELEKIEDDRGFFARSYCQEEFREHGLCHPFVQCNISYNVVKGTLRGMHYQIAPHEEAKLVRCTAGAVYDVILDLRIGSTTYKKWIAAELSAVNHNALYIPEGVAHGFITLEDHTELFYQMGDFFAPEYAKGVRWNDPAFQIRWPFAPAKISARDNEYADYTL